MTDEYFWLVECHGCDGTVFYRWTKSPPMDRISVPNFWKAFAPQRVFVRTVGVSDFGTPIYIEEGGTRLDTPPPMPTDATITTDPDETGYYDDTGFDTGSF